MIQLPPYQSFFSCNSQFNLDIYHKLLNNFLAINSYSIESFGEYNIDGEVIPIYTDMEIYKTLWASTKAGLFDPRATTNIIISYVASNLNCDDIFNTKLLTPIFNNKPKTNDADEVKDQKLKTFVINQMGSIINRRKKEAIERKLQPYNCLNDNISYY